MSISLAHASRSYFAISNPIVVIFIGEPSQLRHDDSEKHRVLHTKDGKEALEIARRVKPDLILMDIQLPEVSGLEVTKWLKQDEGLKEIPIIAVTSAGMKGDEKRVRE